MLVNRYLLSKLLIIEATWLFMRFGLTYIKQPFQLASSVEELLIIPMSKCITRSPLNTYLIAHNPVLVNTQLKSYSSHCIDEKTQTEQVQLYGCAGTELESNSCTSKAWVQNCPSFSACSISTAC